MLSGVVEMDDAYFGAPRKGKDGRGTDKSKAVQIKPSSGELLDYFE